MLEHIKRMFASIAKKIRAFFQKHERKIVRMTVAVIYAISFFVAFTCGAYPLDNLLVTAIFCFVINFFIGACLASLATSAFFAAYLNGQLYFTTPVRRTYVYNDCTTFHYPYSQGANHVYHA